MYVEKNWQKVEHELYRVSFLLNDYLKDKNTRRFNPEVRAFIQQLIDFSHEAAECVHNKQDFATTMEIWAMEPLPGFLDRFDADGFSIDSD